MKRIVLDTVKCTGLGLCEAAAPTYFEINDDGDLDVLATEVPDAEVGTVKAAITACPTLALTLVDE